MPPAARSSSKTAPKTPTNGNRAARRAPAAATVDEPDVTVRDTAGQSQLSVLPVPYWYVDAEGVERHVEVPLRLLRQRALMGRGPEYLRAQANMQTVADEYAAAEAKRLQTKAPLDTAEVAQRLDAVLGGIEQFLAVIAFRADRVLASQLVFGRWSPPGWTGYGEGDVYDKDGDPFPPDGGLRNVQEMISELLKGLGPDPS